MSSPIHFFKYQGTGNDFVLVDLLADDSFDYTDLEELSRRICDRHFGVGSDGLIILKPHERFAFTMDFLNPDGSRSFCGNGSRCAIRHFLSQHQDLDEFHFEAIDGPHIARKKEELIGVNMVIQQAPEAVGDDLFIHTGSPHYLRFGALGELNDMIAEARAIRYSESYKEAGVNVNFIESFDSGIRMRTYERGVEDETLSCGTGVTAAALGSAIRFNLSSPVAVSTSGGNLEVSFERNEDQFTEVFLYGPAELVFKGTWL